MTPRAALPPSLLLLAACAGAGPGGTGGPRRGEAAVVDSVALAAAPAGGLLAPGEVATACGIEGAALGQPIQEAAGYVIHDTAPGSTLPRTHYVTGFADGCPRQVTAALVVLGDPATHEVTRYSTQGTPYGEADEAYEQVKGRVCGVPAGQPCGAAIDRLSADTAFLSAYPVFGGEARTDVLFHRGEVVAVDPSA